MTKTIQATALKSQLKKLGNNFPCESKSNENSVDEIAVVDVREAGEFGEGHLFWAVNIPYSRLEIEARRLLPCKNVFIVLVDSGDSVSEKARKCLANLGYHDVTILKGGVREWKKAGYNLFKGVNVPSKSFGELVELNLHTPHISADQLQTMKNTDTDLVILDGRTTAEYTKMTIPGAKSCPNGELAHRIHKFIDSEDTTVVINCAGRTRSIMGTQTLLNLGIKNPVFALENGTQGWQLAGYELDYGKKPETFPILSDADNVLSHEYGNRIRSSYQIPAIELAQLETWLNDKEQTTYLLDVRTEEEYISGHWPEALHAPGGQLVQATDQWIAVRGAHIVLMDDTGLRAATTAMWLKQMGHNVYVADFDITENLGVALDTGKMTYSETDNFLLPNTRLENCEVFDLNARLAGGALLLDLNHSMDYRKGHIEGAVWGLRPELPALGFVSDQEIIITAATRAVAEIAANDLCELGCSNLSYVPGTAAEWREAGLEVVETPELPPDHRARDYLFFVHDRHQGNLEAARRYLQWETELISLMDDQEQAVFEIQQP